MFWVLVLGVWVLGFGFWVLGFGFGVWDFVLVVLSLGLRVSGSGFKMYWERGREVRDNEDERVRDVNSYRTNHSIQFLWSCQSSNKAS